MTNQLENRLNQLEKSCRRLQRLVVVMLLCLVATFSISAVRATQDGGKIQLIDDGKPRLVMSMINKEPCLTFYNKKGEAALAIGSNDSESGFVSIYGPNHIGGLELKTDKAGGVLFCYDAAQRMRALLGIGKDSGAQLNLYKADSKTPVVMLQCSSDEGQLITVDKDGKPASVP